MRLSYHAQQRIEEMGVSAQEVLDTIQRPEMSYPDKLPDRRRLVRDRILVVLSNDGHTVITVLWNTAVTGRTGRTAA